MVPTAHAPGAACGQDTPSTESALALEHRLTTSTNHVGVSVVVPVFNEARRVPATLRAITDYFSAAARPFEILVVDDGSTDSTVTTVEAMAIAAVRVLRLPNNRGKGAAVRVGMLAARHPWVLMSDADLSTPIEEFTRLSRVVESGADIAIGSRAVDGAQIEVHQHPAREYTGRFFNALVRHLLMPDLWDTQCGFKLFTRSAARRLFEQSRVDGFSFDVEVLFLAHRSGLRVSEVPVHWRHDASTRVSMAGGLRAFVDILRIRAVAATGGYGSGPRT